MLLNKTILIALGGNALAPSTGQGTIAEQFEHTRQSLKGIMPLVREGNRIAITHGNGPQVGDELMRVELSAHKVPTLPLGLCVAATQGTIGYMIEQSLHNALLTENIHRDVVSLITQVIVDENDPAVHKPTKFIGPRYDKDRAEQLAKQFGWSIKEQDGYWRQVVASPAPIRINNVRSIRHLVENGSIVIASGGGGIPTYVMENGHFEGFDGVIDKDLASSVLATAIDAAELYILTDVPQAFLNWGTDHATPLYNITVDEAHKYLLEEQFPYGSMGPKVKAAIKFMRNGGKKVVITNIENMSEALRGNGGTIIT